jgi:hypothetical protein
LERRANRRKSANSQLRYSLEDIPPLYLCIHLGLQVRPIMLL